MSAINKSTFITFLLLVTAMALRAQEPEPALLRVHYDFVHVHDTLQPDKPIQEEMVLYLGQYSTLYGSFEFDRIVRDLHTQVKAPGFDGNLTILNQRHTSPSSYYIHHSEGRLTQIYRSQGVSYLLEESFPSMAWEIQDELKELGGFMSQKAVTAFGGREYIVWFTAEIPLQAGPWKLQGLPGLILEATSVDGEVKFLFAGLDKEMDGAGEIGIPPDAVKTTPDALGRLLDAITKNPQAAFNARSAGANPGSLGASTGDQIIRFSGSGNPMSGAAIDFSSVKSISVKKDHSSISSVTNNPIEKK